MKLCLSCTQTFTASTWNCPYCDYKPEIRIGFPTFAPELASDEGFKDSHFHELVALESRNFWFRARNRLILWALKCYFPIAESMLEIGCGTGFVLSGVATSKAKLVLSGSEISNAGLAYASSRVSNADFFQMDARAIPFVDEFDVIGAFDVLEHINEDEVVLSQMYRAVRPGGGILLTVPQHDFLWSYTDEHACHVRRYSAKDLVAKVSAAGFSVVRMTSFVSLLLPLMMASRSLKPMADDKYDSMSELRIDGFINYLFEKVMTVERSAIRAGLNFPAGGSLLLVARKNL